MKLTGQHILIVDDNLKNLQVTAKLLKDKGFLISLAQDGKSALLQLKTLIPNLILLDMMMPEMDGLEVCRLIKQSPLLQDIPVIFLTAKDQTEDLIAGFNAGGVDYIVKPFNQEELLIRIKNHLELAASKQKIIELDKMRDKLYSIIAHDIRSPFASIAFTLDAITEGYVDPASEDFKEIIYHLGRTSKQTCTLLDNLLEWTKFQSGSIELKPELIKMHLVVDDCVLLLKSLAMQKHITIHSHLDADDLAYFDEVTMHTVFRNLISNAIKFTPEKGTISIKSEKNDKYLVVQVSDSGIGMSEQVIHKIFEENEHYTTKGTRDEMGNGLGLVMVKDFIAKNKGKLEVKSQKDVGTSFFVSIPIQSQKKRELVDTVFRK